MCDRHDSTPSGSGFNPARKRAAFPVVFSTGPQDFLEGSCIIIGSRSLPEQFARAEKARRFGKRGKSGR
jgi:hypothetical protein